MSIDKLYFSATATTRKCVDAVALAVGIPEGRSFNLADRYVSEPISFGGDDCVVVGAPVYGGRIPDLFAVKLRQIDGNGAKAVAMVVYGNRDYDDALLELRDILSERGFRVMAAGAFVAQHSIFPKAGMSRPDAADIARLKEFGAQCQGAFARTDSPVLSVKGNRPYKKYGEVALHPVGSEDGCRICGICSDLCPSGAIDAGRPWTTDASKCISCGRCIVSCPAGVRRYKGLKYKLIGKIFTTMFSARKEPETFV